MKRMFTNGQIAAAKKAITEAAKKNGVTEELFRAEITKAVMEAYNNPNPSSRAHWESIPCAGEIPTPEEVIIWVSLRVTGS